MPTVFSAQGTGHVSDGDPDLLAYQTTNVKIPPVRWNGSTFTASVEGVYFFCITFVKDSYAQGGTQDDVFIILRKNDTEVGRAWCGEGGGRRATGAFNAALQLKKGDVVGTWAASDGGYKRHIAQFQFAGFLIP
jgi:hypothetical protein